MGWTVHRQDDFSMRRIPEQSRPEPDSRHEPPESRRLFLSPAVLGRFLPRVWVKRQPLRNSQQTHAAYGAPHHR
jgi:hypothetical protein